MLTKLHKYLSVVFGETDHSLQTKIYLQKVSLFVVYLVFVLMLFLKVNTMPMLILKLLIR